MRVSDHINRCKDQNKGSLPLPNVSGESASKKRRVSQMEASALVDFLSSLDSFREKTEQLPGVLDGLYENVRYGYTSFILFSCVGRGI